MGRLELAGIDPVTTPPARWWRALWALFVEYKANFSEDADTAVRAMWSQIAGSTPGEVTDAVRPAAPAQAPAAASSAPPRPRPSAGRPPRMDAPIDPETGQPRRPTAAEREAWAVAFGAGSGPLVDDATRGRGRGSGSAEPVGGGR